MTGHFTDSAVANIPAELKDLKRWAWSRLPEKRPLSRDGRPAKSNDPTTWLTFDEAVQDARQHEGAAVGMFMGDGLSGVDFDHIFTDGEGAQRRINLQAQELLNRLRGYTEQSQSGTGLHVVGRPAPGEERSLPHGAKTKWPLSGGAAVEVFKERQYMILTGKVYQGRGTLEPLANIPRNPDESVYQPPPAAPEAPTDREDTDDAELIAKVRQTEKGRRLVDEGFSEGEYASPSEADQALANIFALHTDDAAQIERCLRQSKLGREKWFTHRTYLSRTIQKALAWAKAQRVQPEDEFSADPGGPSDAQGDVAALIAASSGAKISAPPWPFLKLRDVLRAPPMEWLIKGLYPRNGLVYDFAPRGSFKSIIALDQAIAIAAGDETWHGLPIPEEVRGRPVVYIVAEGQNGLGPRVKAAVTRRRVNQDAPIYFLPRSGNLRDENWVQTFVKQIRGVCGDRNPALIVIDPLFRNMGGGNENQQQDMSQFVAGCDALRSAFGCCVKILHNTNREQKVRGSTVLGDAADAEIEVMRRGMEVTYKATKQKDGRERAWRIHIAQEADGAAPTVESVQELHDTPRPAQELTVRSSRGLTPHQTNALRLVADAGPGGLSKEEWNQGAAEQFDINSSPMAKIRQALLKHGCVKLVQGRFFLNVEPIPEVDGGAL